MGRDEVVAGCYAVLVAAVVGRCSNIRTVHVRNRSTPQRNLEKSRRESEAHSSNGTRMETAGIQGDGKHMKPCVRYAIEDPCFECWGKKKRSFLFTFPSFLSFPSRAFSKKSFVLNQLVCVLFAFAASLLAGSRQRKKDINERSACSATCTSILRLN